MTGRAFLHGRNADLDLGTARCVLERQLEVVTQVGTTEHAVAAASPSLSLPEDLAEDVAERICESAEALRTGAASKSTRCIHAGVTELVVRGAFLGVAQDLVR